jgi:hypothetical protein
LLIFHTQTVRLGEQLLDQIVAVVFASGHTSIIVRWSEM